MNQTIRELKRQFAGERLAPEQLKGLIRAGYVYRNGDGHLLTDKGRDALAQPGVYPGGWHIGRVTCHRIVHRPRRPTYFVGVRHFSPISCICGNGSVFEYGPGNPGAGFPRSGRQVSGFSPRGSDPRRSSRSLRETLDRICFALTDDHSVMPAALCYQINASCKPDEDLQSGANYAAGAAVVQANFETWRRSTTDQLGFAASARSKNALVIAELTFLAKGYQLRAGSGSIELFAEGTAPRSGGSIANWMRSGFGMGTVEANPERTRPIAHQMYLPTPVVFTTGVADAGDYYIVASGEVDLACRITHIPRALFA